MIRLKLNIARIATLSSLAICLVACGPPAKPESKIFDAARDGKLGEIQAHIHWKTDLETKGPSDFTALHFAVVFKHKDIVETLLKAGAKVDSTDNRGYTALHKAAFAGETDLVKLLLLNKANINALDNDKMSAYQLATVNKHKETAEFLKSKGADTKLRPLVNHPRSATPGG